MEKFKISIDAESPDGQAVKCEASIQINCSADVAINVMASIIKKDKALKEIFSEALIMAYSNEQNSEEIDESTYNDKIGPTDLPEL